VPPRTPSFLLTTAVVPWFHPVRRHAHTAPQSAWPDPLKPQRKRRHLITDIGGKGTQIRTQIRVCGRCHAQAEKPAERPVIS
jgi:hypothetical protein